MAQLGRFLASINVSFGAIWSLLGTLPGMASSLRLTSSKDLVNGLGTGDDPFHLALHLTPTWHKMSGCHNSSNMFPYQSKLSLGGLSDLRKGFKGIYLDILDQSFAGQGNNQLKGPFSMQIMAKNERGIIVLYWLTNVWLFVTCTKHQYLYQYTVKRVCVCVVCVSCGNKQFNGSTFEVHGATRVLPGPVKMYLQPFTVSFTFVLVPTAPHRSCLEICVGWSIYCNWTKPQN